MRDWLANFTLPDGFKPYNADFATEFAKKMIDQGIEGIPSDPAAQLDLFGMGWWEICARRGDQAADRGGFKQDADKKWLNPMVPTRNHDKFAIQFEVQSGRLAFAVADSWRKFGLTVNVQQLESGPFWNVRANGNYNAGSYWPGCGTIPDVYYFLNSA